MPIQLTKNISKNKRHEYKNDNSTILQWWDV